MKGIVLSKDQKNTTLLRADGTFVTLSGDFGKVGEEILFPKKKKAITLALAASLFLVLSLFAFVYTYHLPKSFLYVDVNPSFCLKLNSFDQVIAVTGLNEEADLLLEGTPTFPKNVDACLEAIVSLCQNEGYLNEENTDVEIRISAKERPLTQALTAATEKMENENLEVSVYSMEKESSKTAQRKRISAQRLRALENYTLYFGGTLEENTEKLQSLSTSEIFAAVRKHREESRLNSQNNTPTKSTEKTLRYSSQKRMEAIEDYTEALGGTVEENAELLQGLSSKEIREKILEYKKSNRQVSAN